MKKAIFYFFSLLFLFDVSAQQAIKISSPNGDLRLKVMDFKGKTTYMLTKNNDTIVDYSSLGLTLKNDSFENLELIKADKRSCDEIWEQVWGEERFARNNYNELALTYQEKEADKRIIRIVFRVFDDGFAFRYEFPEQSNLKHFVILSEDSEITLPTSLSNSTIWSQKANGTLHYEAFYLPKPILTKDTINPPATIVTTKNLHLCISEAAVWDYPATNYTVSCANNKVTFKTNLYPWRNGDAVRVDCPSQSPWRSMIIADNAEKLLLSRLNLNLNEPCALKDVSWIKPSKYVGIWWGMHKRDYSWGSGPNHGATTERTKKYIDFAAQNNISAVLVEGWNIGWDEDWGIHGDRFDFIQAYPDYDLQEVCRYGKEKGVRIIAHLETGGAARNLERQMDSAFALYKSLGINTIKTGYVNMWNDDEYQHSQKAINHYNLVVKTAAKYNLMVVAHEAALPSGIRRTYPNIIGTECMRGQEYNSWDNIGNTPNHTCTLPFTRGLTGPMDFTPGIFNFENKIQPQTHPHTTIAKQLSEYLVLYSPAPMAADMIENYEANMRVFEFIKQVPCAWDSTVVPHAEVGRYVTIARKEKNTNNWYVGSMTDETPRDLDLELSFLDKGKQYTATIYEDGEGADYRTNPYPVNIRKIVVGSKDTIKLKLAPSGGAAISIVEIK